MNVAIASPLTAGGVADFTGKLLEGFQPVAKQYVWSRQDLRQLDFALSSDCTFLQYSGYGFAKRGAPLWLLRELRRRRDTTHKLGIFFHELFAMGPIWSSAFWLSPLQRTIARELAQLSDFWVTNREASADWLRRYAGNKPHAVLPVFSNVGEMPAYLPTRAGKVIVFGGAGLRLATYRAGGNVFFAWAKRQGLEIHDVGPSFADEDINARLADEGVTIHGRLNACEVSSVMADAMFGVVQYPVDYVAKSGVFAAYCAHGLCPILLSNHYPSSDGLTAGVQYLPGIPDKELVSDAISTMGQAAWTWYQPHRLSAHLSVLRALMSES